MKTTQELLQTAISTIKENGINIQFHEDYYMDGSLRAVSLANETFNLGTYHPTVDGRGWYTDQKGIALTVSVVYRRNGTDENKSIQLEIIRRYGHCGCLLHRVKLSGSFSDRKVAQLINETVEKYNEFTAQ